MTQQLNQQNFYDSRIPNYLDYEKNRPYSRYLAGKMMEVSAVKTNSILEVGAGEGRFTFELARNTKKLTAIDISGKEINRLRKSAQKLKIKNITAFRGDILKMGNVQLYGMYDQAAGFFILHHLPGNLLEDVVLNLKSRIKSGGRMVFIEPNSLYPFHLVEMAIKKDMEWRIEKGIYTGYLGIFRRASEKEGFKTVVFRRFGFIPPPLINLIPWITVIDKIIERIPLINLFFCPFVLMAFEKD